MGSLMGSAMAALHGLQSGKLEMTTRWETIWTFKTARDLSVTYDNAEDFGADLSRGDLVSSQARLRVTLEGLEVGCEYLGGCIYKNLQEFRDHIWACLDRLIGND